MTRSDLASEKFHFPQKIMAFKRVEKVLQKAKNYFREKFNARPTFAVYAPETANIFGGFIYGFDNQGFIYCTVSSKIFSLRDSVKCW